MKKKQKIASAKIGMDRHNEQNAEVSGGASFGAELRWIGYTKGLKKEEYAGFINISKKNYGHSKKKVSLRRQKF
jgi:hypothetical protein